MKKKKNKNENDETMMITINGSRQACSCAERKKKITVFNRRRAGRNWKPNGNCLKRNGKTLRRHENESATRNNNAFYVFRTSHFHPPEPDLLTFLISNRGPFSEDENGRKKANENSQRDGIRISLRKKFSRLLKDEDKEDVMEMVKEIYQSGTALMNTLSWDG